MIDLTGYKLTFDEEFNTRSISQGAGTKWADIRATSRMSPDADIGFGMSAFVDASSGIDPFDVSGGALTITARRADSSIVGPGQWASGLIHTQNSFSQLYGYFEIRADLPADKGVWPAFWLLRADGVWPPEIDILEAYGDTNLWQYVHSNAGGTHTQDQIQTQHADMLSGYHTYGVLWKADFISFYYDGELVGKVPTPSDMHSPMFLLADLAMQPGIAGTTDTAKSMSIDYIRVYSDDPNANAVALDTVSSPDGADTDGLYGATSAGSSPGTDDGTLTLHVSSDHYLGGAQFAVFVDGRQVGGLHTVDAHHVLGQWQDITIAGNFDPADISDIEIRFVNDAWDGVGGGEGHDRNLYVRSVKVGGETLDWTQATGNVAPWSVGAAVIASNGGIHFALTPDPDPPDPPPPDPPPPDPTPTGEGSLKLHVSSDHYQGGAKFEVYVDGVKIGGILTVDAVHVLGQWQDFVITGDFDPSTVRRVDVRFLNDAWDGVGGGEGHDRNLFVESLTIDGETLSWTAATGNVAPWSAGSAAVATNGDISFVLSDSPPTPPPPPTPPDPPDDPAPPEPPASGDSTFHVRVSSDHYLGGAQFLVFVDGVQIGGTRTVDAVHARGEWEDIAITGDFELDEVETIEFRFVNDAWDGVGGGEGHDRNLYVQNLSIGGHTLDWTEATGNVAPWSAGSAAVATNGGVFFHIDHLLL